MMQTLHIRLLGDFRRWWSAQGRSNDARQRLSDVYSWFTEGFDTPDQQAARLLLAHL